MQPVLKFHRLNLQEIVFNDGMQISAARNLKPSATKGCLIKNRTISKLFSFWETWVPVKYQILGHNYASPTFPSQNKKVRFLLGHSF